VKSLHKPIDALFRKTVKENDNEENKVLSVQLKLYQNYPIREIKAITRLGTFQIENAKEFFEELRQIIITYHEKPPTIPNSNTTTTIPKEPPEEIDLKQVYYAVGKLVKAKGRIAYANKGVTKDGAKAQFLFQLDGGDKESELQIPVTFVTEDKNSNPMGLVEVQGIVRHMPSHSELIPSSVYIEGLKVDPTEQDFMFYKPTPKDKEEFKKYFGQITNDNIITILDGTIAPAIVGRALAKALIGLAAFTPVESPFEGRKTFCITVVISGDSRESKSAICKDLVFCLLPAGSIRINAEMAKKTGLIGSVVIDPITGAWCMRWGKLPSAHKGLAVLDGISTFPEDVLPQVREIMSERMAEIWKVVGGLRPMWVRLIMIGNSRRRANLYRNKIDAVRDTGSGETTVFGQQPDWLRVHIPIGFAEQDVPFQARDESLASSLTIKRVIPAEVFKKYVMDVWRRSIDDYQLKPEVIPRIRQVLDQWRKQFSYVDLAILKAEGIHILLLLTYAVAALKYRIDNAYKIVVELEDVECVKSLLEMLFEDLGLRKASEQEQILDEKARRIADPRNEAWDFKLNEYDAIETYYDMILILFNNEQGKLNGDELTKALNVSRNTLWHRKNLIESKIQEKFGIDTPPILQSTTGFGFKLTDFGMKVAKYRIECADRFIEQLPVQTEEKPTVVKGGWFK